VKCLKTLGQPLVGKNKHGGGERDRGEENAVNSGHYVPSAKPKGSKHNLLRPILQLNPDKLDLEFGSTPVKDG
jgi:hypothetical protein